MSQKTCAFVSTCSTCTQNKTSRQALPGLFLPLPIPHHPWSHIAVDFVTGLPLSQGNTVILIIVGRFSKSVHFVGLVKLPSTPEPAELLIRYVFRLYRISSDNISDRGPQFFSQGILPVPGSHHQFHVRLSYLVQWSV